MGFLGPWVMQGERRTKQKGNLGIRQKIKTEEQGPRGLEAEP